MANKLEGTLELNVNPAGVGANPVGRPAKNISESAIRRLYVDEVKSLGAVAAALGVATLTIRARMEEFGIPVRKRGRPVKGAAKIVGGAVELDSDFAESEGEQNALTALLEAEAAELAKADEPEAEAVTEAPEATEA